MGGHRETRRESDAFKARLEERSSEDRHRLAAEHRAYLAGEHATDADFGPGEARAAQAPQPAHVPRPTKTPSRPPMGKAAAYLAALKKRKAENDGERVDSTLAPKRTKRRAKGKRSVSITHLQSEGSGKLKELTQKEKAALANEEKAAQEAIAVSRDRAEATKKTLARAKKHHTADREEKRAQKKGKKGQETAVASVGAGKKKKRRTCPHDAFSDGDADDESNISSSTRAFSERETPRASADGRPNESTSLLQLRPAARTLVLVVSNSPEPEAVSVALPADQTSGDFGCAGMDSDVEGDNFESGNGYFEDHNGVEDEAESEELRDKEEGAEGGEEEGDETDSAENHLDGAAIIARRKKMKRRDWHRSG
ncbi:hypothetical protein PC129_g22590 [Phytophthora cactorum]|uniref:Uncharacterized protein n=1 Tax=Phytophthora cactorum TaxID=29920 RepID=A0A8T1F1L4_9STRA|nr:hypothetical protein Pcac1_g20056 [Phytophthora cactorum]KAG2886846.1 hypothetical protein PC117_g25287 [Phytophthora cactorum]KAG2959753.1 hypothetical protein PC118_g22861 [Phytophthora cactorum]KAG3204397.1 hypothetical protein PC129_g22590 [Phytophthora cactorum]KAG4224398.1 hypothetical protein PC116_g27146 [Phytophthora cactorum]